MPRARRLSTNASASGVAGPLRLHVLTDPTPVARGASDRLVDRVEARDARALYFRSDADLMVARERGVAGAAVAATAAFLPSFIIMLIILPVLDRVRKLAWMRAVMKGMGPAVIGVLAVSLIRLAPAALPDPFAIAILAATLLALIIFRTGVFRLMIAGAALGVLRSYLPVLRGFRAATRLFTT